MSKILFLVLILMLLVILPIAFYGCCPCSSLRKQIKDNEYRIKQQKEVIQYQDDVIKDLEEELEYEIEVRHVAKQIYKIKKCEPVNA